MDIILIGTIVGGVIAAGSAVFLSIRLSRERFESAQTIKWLETQLAERTVQTQELDSLRREVLRLSSERAELDTLLTKERESLQEKVALLRNAEERLAQTFKALSAEVLAANNESFLTLARERFDVMQEKSQGHLNLHQKNIEGLLDPVKKALGQVDEKINLLEKERVGAYQGLRQQITDLLLTQRELRSETANLVNALRKPSVRGRWGEMQLRRVVELAGMVSFCDFVEQDRLQDGAFRPDLMVKLPGGKMVVVDAKAPLSAYLEALEAQDELEKNRLMREHAKQVRVHMQNLSSKAYWDKLPNTPEFVVLFLPGEMFFSAALESDPNLIEDGLQHKVVLATPTTLIALLRSVAYGWRQETLAQNAQVVSQLGREMYKRLFDVSDHITRLGRSLTSSVDSYNRLVGSFEGRVLVSARRFKDLGVTDLEIPEVPPVEKTIRPLLKEEIEDLLLLDNENETIDDDIESTDIPR